MRQPQPEHRTALSVRIVRQGKPTGKYLDSRMKIEDLEDQDAAEIRAGKALLLGVQLIRKSRATSLPMVVETLYDGVFLGERDGIWIAGRMFLGKSMRDGFTESGEWRGATQFTDPAMHEAYRAHLALQDCIRQAEDAGDCWDGMFNQQAQAAIDRHWGRAGTADRCPRHVSRVGASRSGGDVRGHTCMLPAVDAKYELLAYMRRSYVVNDAFREFVLRDDRSRLKEAYETAIQAAGPVKFSVAGDHFSLSFDGSCNDNDSLWRTTRRNPHPTERATDRALLHRSPPRRPLGGPV
ncbi:hypothetical protein ACWCQQ_38300 [Streptomyces sp. NPDC002143]